MSVDKQAIKEIFALNLVSICVENRDKVPVKVVDQVDDRGI